MPGSAARAPARNPTTNAKTDGIFNPPTTPTTSFPGRLCSSRAASQPARYAASLGSCTIASTLRGCPRSKSSGASKSAKRVFGNRGATTSRASMLAKSTITRSKPCCASRDSVPTRSSRMSGEMTRPFTPVLRSAATKGWQMKSALLQPDATRTTRGWLWFRPARASTAITPSAAAATSARRSSEPRPGGILTGLGRPARCAGAALLMLSIANLPPRRGHARRMPQSIESESDLGHGSCE